MYYRAEVWQEDTRPRRTIALSNCVVVDEGPKRSGPRNGSHIFWRFSLWLQGTLQSERGPGSGALLRVSCEGQREAQQWLSCLQAAGASLSHTAEGPAGLLPNMASLLGTPDAGGDGTEDEGPPADGIPTDAVAAAPATDATPTADTALASPATLRQRRPTKLDGLTKPDGVTKPDGLTKPGSAPADSGGYEAREKPMDHVTTPSGQPPRFEHRRRSKMLDPFVFPASRPMCDERDLNRHT